ncbi:MAG TPA: amidophosphoribosyltransferase [Clostridia bacterium]|nr:amidophosphoribosyltransferase [Clostridia bacterium]
MKTLREDDKLKEACGIFGIYSNQEIEDIGHIIYHGLYALQHRGQESAGIAVSDGNRVNSYKGMGLVPEVFAPEVIELFIGRIGLGHVRYSTTGSSLLANAQPLVVKTAAGTVAIAHNGNLVNADLLRAELEEQGSIFQTSIDSEVIANLIARSGEKDFVQAVAKSVARLRGSFALGIMTENKLIGIRDPHGFRPLCLGKLDGAYVLASESCALDTVDAEFIRDIEPGEMVIIDENGVRSYFYTEPQPKALCIFEFIYFARPDSVIDGMSVQLVRNAYGKRLALEHPVEADLVIPVPDSGTSAAIGYAEQSKIPFGEGLVKNRYVGRTFIQPTQKKRETSVKIKLNPIRKTLAGKRVVLVDDSIVRGTTSKRIIQMIRDAGAKEVHLRISSPIVNNPCYFGIDISSPEELIGATHSVEEIRREIGCDSLGYLSMEGMGLCMGVPPEQFCKGCFDGCYPLDVSHLDHKKKSIFE